MHGIGNDFVMFDGRAEVRSPEAWNQLAQAVCDRHKGVGADGLIGVFADEDGALRMRMWNPDGSESSMCGNGLRCFARFAHRLGLFPNPTLELRMGGQTLVLEMEPPASVRVQMGRISFDPESIGTPERLIEATFETTAGSFVGTAVSVGNPHLVIFVDDVAAIALEDIGPVLEHHPAFNHRTNVHFVQVEGPTRLIQRTWERGAGITLACGSGACAVVAAAHETKRSESAATVVLPGGELKIELGPDHRVAMTGPAEFVFDGVWPD